jgi:hypothetical protein
LFNPNETQESIREVINTSRKINHYNDAFTKPQKYVVMNEISVKIYDTK